MTTVWIRSLTIVASLMLFSVWAVGIPSSSVGADDRPATSSPRQGGQEAVKKQPSHGQQKMVTKGSQKRQRAKRNKLMEITKTQDEKSAVSF